MTLVISIYATLTTIGYLLVIIKIIIIIMIMIHSFIHSLFAIYTKFYKLRLE